MLKKRCNQVVFALALCAILGVSSSTASASAIRVAETILDVDAVRTLAEESPRVAGALSAGLEELARSSGSDILMDPPDGHLLRARNVLFDDNPPDVTSVLRGSVSPNLGVETSRIVSVRHDLSSWVVPAPNVSTFDGVVVTIFAMDRDGGREVIVTDEGFVGVLKPGSGFTVNFDLLGNVVGSLRQDGQVLLRIRPVGFGNEIQVLGTRISANVQPGQQPMPEPHASAAFAIGLLLASRAVRRRRA